MKLVFKGLVLCMAAGISSLRAQEAKFTLTIKTQKPTVGYKAFLQYQTAAEKNQVDSAAYKNGKCEIKGTALQSQKAFLYLGPENKGFGTYSVTLLRIPVYLEKGKILVSGAEGLKGAKLSGTPLNDVFQGYADVVNSYSPRLETLREAYGKANAKKDIPTLRTLTAGFSKLEQETKKAQEQYFHEHLNSPVSLEWLRTSFSVAKDKSRVTTLYGKLDDEVRNSGSGKTYGKLLEETKSVEIGQPAPDFIARNVAEEEISLSSFKGKYVLLDFWASWCQPCREENPNVLKAYETYKSKNFTVVGYTMDSSKKSWENAIIKDGLVWTQLSGFGLNGNLPAKLFAITAIPNNFLIDPSGKIIGMNLRGEDLQEALAKLLR